MPRASSSHVEKKKTQVILSVLRPPTFNSTWPQYILQMFADHYCPRQTTPRETMRNTAPPNSVRWENIKKVYTLPLFDTGVMYNKSPSWAGVLADNMILSSPVMV